MMGKERELAGRRFTSISSSFHPKRLRIKCEIRIDIRVGSNPNTFSFLAIKQSGQLILFGF